MLRARGLSGPFMQRTSAGYIHTAGNYLGATGAYTCTTLPVVLRDADGNAFVDSSGDLVTSGAQRVCAFSEQVVLTDAEGNVFTNSDGTALWSGANASVYRSA